MKLERATIYLQADFEGAGFADTNTLNEAKRLGIEALELITKMRRDRVIAATFPLPSETKD